MSKFDDLVEAYKNAREDYINYENLCYEFMIKLLNKLIDFWQCPKEYITWIPLDVDVKPNDKYSIPGAMTLKEDGSWHLGLVINLYSKSDVYPQDRILLNIGLKMVGESFMVKLGNWENELTIHNDKEEEFLAFFNKVHQTLIDYYGEGIKDFLKNEVSTREIGFHP